LLDAKLRYAPITYYYIGGGISQVFDSVNSPRRIAVIGLGSGATAAYSRKDDIIDYFEIDPDHEAMAQHWFTYLEDCKGKTSVVVGDGRLFLQKMDREVKCDLIFVDAFSGDGIPTHLLTREAMAIYLNRLADHGIILYHLSSR
jgi:spermidine synthase